MNTENNGQTRVLFVCVHNAARSQMAEAFLNRLGEGKFTGESAGFTPAPINPYVIRAMAEIGYDLSGKQANDIFVYFRQERKYEIVVKVCDLGNGQRCPIFPSTRITLNWPFPDPAGFTGTDEMIMDRVRRLRDDILARVRELIDTYGG
jgi:arsenate reductase